MAIKVIQLHVEKWEEGPNVILNLELVGLAERRVMENGVIVVKPAVGVHRLLSLIKRLQAEERNVKQSQMPRENVTRTIVLAIIRLVPNEAHDLI